LRGVFKDRKLHNYLIIKTDISIIERGVQPPFCIYALLHSPIHLKFFPKNGKTYNKLSKEQRIQ